MLIEIADVFSPQEVAGMRSVLQEQPWVDGKQTAGQRSALEKCNRQLSEDSEVAIQLGQRILARLSDNALFMSGALPKRIYPPLFNRYEGGETYGLHVDGAIRQAGGQMLRADLSCTLFLCEPEDYDGGELEVVDTYGSHEAKLPAGDLLLYPSSSLHRVHPVTRGERVCSFFWLQSLVRGDAQRALLFDMDQSIQKLRARWGDVEETLALTGNYHNLLRMWSEV